jgi:hypothetical protein
VRAVPVDPITRGTPGEAFLCEIDVRWHELKRCFFVDILKGRVTFKTPGKQLEIFQPERLQHLVDLFLVMVALHKQAPGVTVSPDKAGVSRQNDATLGGGNPENLIVFEGVRVRNVEAQHSKPACELSYHYVGNKPDFVHGIIRIITNEESV